MARTLPAVLVATLLLTAGCEPPPLQEQEADFQGLIQNHFSQENKDAELRRSNLRADQIAYQEDPTKAPPTGTVISTYRYDPTGWILYEVVCPQPSCKTRHTFEYIGKVVYCPTCGGMGDPSKDASGWSPLVEANVSPDQFKSRGIDAKPMYELTKKNVEEPLEAVARYFRYTSAFDARAKVNVDDKVITDAGLNPADLPGKGNLPVGMHRPGEVFVGEITFVYSGGHVTSGKSREIAVKPWKENRPTRSK